MNASKQKTWGWVILALAVGLLAGRFTGGDSHADHDHASAAPDAEAEATVWTCSMHPQIQLPQPGACPLCGMDLIPLVASTGAELGERQLRLSPAARKLAEVQVTPVARRILARDIRLVGKVEVDETRLKTITAWVPGRLDRLYVDYTGVKVAEGDHLVSLYSPDLIGAQEELIQAARSASQMSEGTVGIVRERTEAMILTAREKLRLLGLTDAQVRDIEDRGQPDTHLTIHSPIQGIVVQKAVTEGMYVTTGTPIYQIADLSLVWVKLDAYESDLRWLHYGQDVAFETEAYSGESFHGRIAFIAPVVDPVTRTVKVRVNVPNPDGRLKPGLFVRAVVQSSTTDDGRIFAPELAGKYISPMHPEIIKDAPGACDVCGMDLVPIEEFGFTTAGAASDAPLVIPASAPLLTGKRAVVYLLVDEEEGIYEGREIVLGPRAGDHYVVLEGLEEGDLVVRNGAFKIDSAIQIRAQPSMMNPTVARHSVAGVHEESLPPESRSGSLADDQPLPALLAPYFALQEALAADELHPAHQAAADLDESLPGVSALRGADTLAEARVAFEEISTALIAAAKSQPAALDTPVYEAHCPMAFDDRGASWLQRTAKVYNPYFGSQMLHCGTAQRISPDE